MQPGEINEDMVTEGFIFPVVHDGRLGPQHVSMYVAIVWCWVAQGRPEWVTVSGKELGPLAKIFGSSPVYRCLRELHDYGYVVYRPSYNPVEKSKVFLLLTEGDAAGK
jgi:hypothetical protein